MPRATSSLALNPPDYWFALAEYLGREGIALVIVNPHHVHKSKELEDNSPTKND